MMADRFKQHWPDSLGKLERPPPLRAYFSHEQQQEYANYENAKSADFERTGHMQTDNGMRIYPEGYVLLSELDVQRIARAVVVLYQEQVNAEWEKLQGQTILEPIEVRREELSDSEIERIAHRIKELIVG